MNYSLNNLAETFSINRSAIYRAAKTLNLDTSSGISDADLPRLKEALGIVDQPDQQPESITENQLQVISPEVRSRDCSDLVPAQVDLSAWGLQASESIDDPIALAERAIALMDSVGNSLDGHIESLESRANRARQAEKMLREKRSDLEKKALIAQLRSEIYEGRATDAEEALKEQISSLGKSQSA